MRKESRRKTGFDSIKSTIELSFPWRQFGAPEIFTCNVDALRSLRGPLPEPPVGRWPVPCIPRACLRTAPRGASSGTAAGGTCRRSGCRGGESRRFPARTTVSYLCRYREPLPRTGVLSVCFPVSARRRPSTFPVYRRATPTRLRRPSPFPVYRRATPTRLRRASPFSGSAF